MVVVGRAKNKICWHLQECVNSVCLEIKTNDDRAGFVMGECLLWGVRDVKERLEQSTLTSWNLFADF